MWHSKSVNCRLRSVSLPPVPASLLVPASVRRLGRDDVAFIDLDEPNLISPIIMSYRTNDASPMLAQLLTLIREFDEWRTPAVAGLKGPPPLVEADASAVRRARQNR